MMKPLQIMYMTVLLCTIPIPRLLITVISVFPLLGMFGTVIGLLGLDLTTGDMENIRTNFFIALTSTAWGIIFSVIFKVFHAVIADFVEEQIELSKKLTDYIE
mgnify:CR=1 FL=1